jgi:hypothetical protein
LPKKPKNNIASVFSGGFFRDEEVEYKLETLTKYRQDVVGFEYKKNSKLRNFTSFQTINDFKN